MLRLAWFSVLLAACTVTSASDPGSAAGGGGKEDGTGDGEATIAFHWDFTQSTTGALVAGETVHVTYDLSRLQTCRAESNGSQVWGVTGYAQFDDGTTVTLTLSALQQAQVVPVEAELALPASATHVAMWFTQTNEYGCIAYDSDNGQNYAFALQASGSAAVIDFSSDPSAAPTQSAPIVGGGQLVVHYEPDRLSQCNTVGNDGTPAWGVTMYWQVDGGTVQSALASRSTGTALVAADLQIAIPHGSDLAMWFEATNLYGCDAYDSASGANYHFAIR